ncbi:MAG: hypothetical protein QXP36_04600 [Conexivisphaerales archaeon]
MTWRDFEQEVAEFFQARSYDVKYNTQLVGRSGVIHEIEILAFNKKESIACKCKSGNKKSPSI